MGLVRKENEDAFLMRTDVGLFAVADGLGGHQAGEVASWLAVRTVENFLSGAPPGSAPRVLLRQAVALANTEVLDQSRRRSGQRGMGTTLTLAWIIDWRLYLAHVGDSSAYRLQSRSGRMEKLTHDHSLVEEMVRLGGITRQEARRHPQRNVLTRALGIEPEVEPDQRVIPWRRGDRLLLCTDGLSSLLSDAEMAEGLRPARDLEAGLNHLLNLALGRGAPDNVTMVMVSL